MPQTGGGNRNTHQAVDEYLQELEEHLKERRAQAAAAERDTEDRAGQEEKGFLLRLWEAIKEALLPEEQRQAIRREAEALESAGFHAARVVNGEREAAGLPPLEIGDAMEIVRAPANSSRSGAFEGLLDALAEARDAMHVEIMEAGQGEPGALAPGSTPALQVQAAVKLR